MANSSTKTSLLLASGANPACRDNLGVTPIELAMRCADPNIIQILTTIGKIFLLFVMLIPIAEFPS